MTASVIAAKQSIRTLLPTRPLSTLPLLVAKISVDSAEPTIAATPKPMMTGASVSNPTPFSMSVIELNRFMKLSLKNRINNESMPIITIKSQATKTKTIGATPIKKVDTSAAIDTLKNILPKCSRRICASSFRDTFTPPFSNYL